MSEMDLVVLVVLDSVGVGALPDAGSYGDEGANTLLHVAEAVGGLRLPQMARLGLGNILSLPGLEAGEAEGAYGVMAEASPGKDTTTGHWELAGIRLDRPFATFPQGFPRELLEPFCREIGRGVLGNKAASGTEIIAELGEEHVRTGRPIVYTSADSVFQVAAHEGVIPVEELYAMCLVARRLCDPFGVGRVIARPFVGVPGAFVRTTRRHDFSMVPSGETLLDQVSGGGLEVVSIGKIEDIFAGRGVTRGVRTEGNADGLGKLEREIGGWPQGKRGLIFANLIDFDMLYGHRNDWGGYARALEEWDLGLARLLALLGERTMLAITADHGCDPTHPGTDHTREHVPLLVAGPRVRAIDLGVRSSFADLGQTVAEALGVGPLDHGVSFLDSLL